MDKLPEDQRLAIALVLVEGLSYKEAAEVLEIPIGTLTSRLARGRTALAATHLGEPGVNYDDETLMAYADGELDAAQRARNRRGDRSGSGARAPRGTASRVARRSGRRICGGARQPVPERLRDGRARRRAGGAVRRGKVLQFPQRAARRDPGAVARARVDGDGREPACSAC